MNMGISVKRKDVNCVVYTRHILENMQNIQKVRYRNTIYEKPDNSILPIKLNWSDVEQLKRSRLMKYSLIA